MNNAIVTTLGMYNYDSTLFDDLVLPSAISKSDFIDNLMLKYGEMCVMYPDFDTYKYFIGVWSKKWLNAFTRIDAAIKADYNPIYNYDRYEETSDKQTATTTSSTSGTAEEKVSAFNESSYQPEGQTETSGTGSGTTSAELEHTAHMYGNIGVTTSAAMVKEYVDLYGGPDANIYEIMCDRFAAELLLYVY